MRTALNKSIFLTVLAILALSIRFSGQQKGQGLPLQEEHKVEVRLILVDVIAIKDGEFFSGLKKSDFELFEDGTKVSINSCDLVSMGTSASKLTQDKSAVIPDIIERKRLAVLFDGVNAWDREFKKAADEIAGELVSLAKSNMEVMVLFLDNEKGLKIVQPFTDQEALIKAAAERAAGGAFDSFLEYLHYDGLLLAGRYMAEDAKKGRLPPLDDDKSTWQPIHELRMLEHANVATDKLTRSISGLLASLYMLETIPGRKNLLFVSNGFPDLETFRVADQREGINDQFPLTGRIKVFDPFGILGNRVFETGEEVLKEIIRVANDRNISIYSVDPGTFSKRVFAGPSAEYFDRETAASQKVLFEEKSRQIQNLRMISEKTGAVLLRGANKLESFNRVVRNDLSYYYQLSYYPARKKETKGYHKIEIKLRGRKGIEIRARDGYSDSSPKQSQRLVLAKAFYNPEAFLDRLPFKAEFVPFFSRSGKYQPWMNLALPAREFFIDRFTGYGKKAYEFHFWIKEEEESGRVLAGSIAIPFEIDPSFKEHLESLDFLRFYFAGPALVPPDAGYKVVYALFNQETGEVGTWSSILPKPFSKRDKEPDFLNAIVGNIAATQNKRAESVVLDAKDGTLDLGQLKFLPKITGRFSRAEDAHVFFQVYNPEGTILEPQFELINKAGHSQKISADKAADYWNENSKVWSCAYKLNFENTAAADYVLRIEIPSLTAAPTLTKEIKLTIL